MPTAGNEVSLAIDGPGRIIGFDNGDPSDHDSFKSDRRKAFNGLCLAIVQANRQTRADSRDRQFTRIARGDG